MAKGPGNHPNSLANLRPIRDPEVARAAQLKGAAVRKQNRLAREQLKVTAADFQEFKKNVLDDLKLTAVDVLRHQMIKAMTDGEDDKAIEIAKSLAEFETPKMSRIDQVSSESDSQNMTDEELEARLREYANKDNKDA